MIWWSSDTPTGGLADRLRLPAPQHPIEVRAEWERDLRNMLATTRLTYPSGHNRHAGPADRTFADVALVPLVTALIANELDANEACTLDRIHQRLSCARCAQRPALDDALVEIRSRKLVIDAAAELLCSTRVAQLTEGGRYDIRSDVVTKVDLVVRFRSSGPRCIQIKRGLGATLSRPGSLLCVPMSDAEWIGPAVVVTRENARTFVDLTELTYAPDRFSGQMELGL